MLEFSVKVKISQKLSSSAVIIGTSKFYPCHARYFYVLHSTPIFIMLTTSAFQLEACIFKQSGKQCGS